MHSFDTEIDAQACNVSYRLEVMAFQSFSYEIALLLTKYAGRWANFVKKNSEIFGEKKNIILV